VTRGTEKHLRKGETTQIYEEEEDNVNEARRTRQRKSRVDEYRRMGGGELRIRKKTVRAGKPGGKTNTTVKSKGRQEQSKTPFQKDEKRELRGDGGKAKYQILPLTTRENCLY